MTDCLVTPHSLGVRIKMWKGALEVFLMVPPHFMVFSQSFALASLADISLGLQHLLTALLFPRPIEH